MKKLFLFAFATAALCFAACNNGGYRLTGTAVGAEDGDTVVLTTYEHGELDTFATTIVKDGKFKFTGTQDTAAMRLVIWSSNSNPDLHIATWVALENADIHVELDTAANAAAKVTGTPANEALTRLGETERTINQRGEEIYKVFQDPEATDEQQAEAQKKIEALQEECVKIYKTFITENIGNVAGVNYLQQYAPILDDKDVAELLEKVPEQYVNESIVKMRETYRIKAQTAVGKPVQDITADTPEGAQLSVSQVAKDAKVLLIDFWASWCGPCRAEMPNVKATYERFHSQGFEIIGVSLDSDAQSWKSAIAELGMTWPQISDLKGWQSQGAATYGVQAIPATVLVKDGTIVARELRGEELAAKVEELLKD